MTPPPQPSVVQSIKEWIDSVPIITRYILFFTLGISVGAKLGILHPRQIILFTPAILDKYEVWRLLTCHLFSSGSNMIWHIFLLFQNSKNLETGYYSNRRADYVFLLIIMILVMDIIGGIMGYFLLSEAFGMAITYLYANVNGEQVVSFMFGFQFKAMFLPWVMLFVVSFLSVYC